MKERKLLILDLDETLIFSDKTKLEVHDDFIVIEKETGEILLNYK